MSQFIELTDYDASIHREILDALTREDESIVEICEDRTLAEMRGYLSRRYDCDRLFAATGQERNQLVLMMLPQEERRTRSGFIIKSNRKRSNHF